MLTMVLVFSGLLVIGSFDVTDWAHAQSQNHYGSSYYFGIDIWFIDLHGGFANYYLHP